MFPNGFNTARLTFRPITFSDADPIFNTYAQDPDVTRFLTWRPHRRLSETQNYIAHCVATLPFTAQTYMLTERQHGTILGAIDLRLVTQHRLEFGYVLARANWDQGLMTEALSEVVQWALAQPLIFRIGAFCDAGNIGSARVMEKAGLVQEGLLRRWSIHPNISDQPRGCFSYARVR